MKTRLYLVPLLVVAVIAMALFGPIPSTVQAQGGEWEWMNPCPRATPSTTCGAAAAATSLP